MLFRLLLFISLLACAVSSHGSSVSLSVEGAADYALKHNPTLAGARLRIEEARGRLVQSGRLSNPELELEATRMTTGREGSLGVALMQRFPLSARLRYEKAVSRAELTAAEAEVRDGERKMVAEVRAGAVRILALEAQRALRTEQLATSRDLAGFLTKRVEVGEASVVEASQIDLESRQLEVENLQLSAESVALAGALRPLLGLDGETAIRITGSLSSPAALPVKAGVANRPDVQASRFRAEAAAAAVLQQKASRWQDVGVGASYTRERNKDEPEPVETEHVIGLRLTVPLPVWNNNSGRISEAEAAAARAVKEAEATRLTAGAEAVAARAEMSALAKLLAEIDTTVLPKATQIEELLRGNYSLGQVPLVDVLRARARRLELQRLRLDALRDYYLAFYRHSAATASRPLPTKSFK